MALPPKEVSASELWLRIQETPYPSEVVDFPRYRNGKSIGKLRVRVLAEEEHERACMRAHVELKDKAKPDATDAASPILQQVEGDMVARHVLLMACLSDKPTDPDAEKPTYAQVFTSVEQLGKLTADEISVLFAYYQMVQHNFGPFERSTRSPKELDAWISRLAEGARLFPLARLSLPQLAELILSVTQRAYTIFHALASQSSDLPDTLKLLLERLNFDTSLFGEPPDDYSPDGSVDDLTSGHPEHASPETLSFDDALAIVKALRTAKSD